MRDVPLNTVEGEDLYPLEEEGQKRVVDWVRKAYDASRDSKRGYQEKWDKYYKMYRSYVAKPTAGDWRARYWMPIAFFVIETVTPRLVAQLPEAVVEPVEEFDVEPAELMEELIKWASEKTDLYLELVKMVKSALLYGTGILKIMYDETERYVIKQEPVMEEQYAEMPIGETDVDGNPITQQFPLGSKPTGETTAVRVPYLAYRGPVGEAVDIENFFVDPVADDIGTARYVIHKVYRDKAHLEEWFEKGIYKRPSDAAWEDFMKEHSVLRRQDLIGLDTSTGMTMHDKSLIPLLEVWTDKMVVVVAGDQDYSTGVLLRAERNPYGHGEKPFVRIVDHLVPHEFWGIGELEPLEGLQDAINALWNHRIDNVRLVLNSMFLAVMDYIVDPSDLQMSPGRVVRVREGMPLNSAVQRLELGDVTGSSYEEIAELERMSEKASGVSQMTAGLEAPGTLGRTATGLVAVAEQGNTRFAHKVTIAELTGFKRLFRQFGSLLQQYMPEQLMLRMKGPDGFQQWQAVTQEGVAGKFDYQIKSASSTQTQSMKEERAMGLFQLLAQDPYAKPLKVREDLLETFGKKDIYSYILSPEELQQLYEQQAAMEEEAAMEGETEEEGIVA